VQWVEAPSLELSLGASLMESSWMEAPSFEALLEAGWMEVHLDGHLWRSHC
jgi:hypothetical protein